MNHVTATSNSADLDSYQPTQMDQGLLSVSGPNTIGNFDQQVQQSTRPAPFSNSQITGIL